MRCELSDAIRGTEADYTRIGMRRAIFLLAVPMMLDQWLANNQSFF